MASPTHERVVFAVSFEAMFVRALGPDLPEKLVSSLAKLNVNLKNLQPAYPLTVWQEALAAARRTLYPTLSDGAAYEQLGRAFVRSYFETIIGRAVRPLLKVLGTRRSLQRMRQNFRGGNNFSETTLETSGRAHLPVPHQP